MSLSVTDVRIRKVEGREKLRALASITFEDCFVVNEVKVIKGKNGLFVAMPSTKDKKGLFRDIAHPIKSDLREHITDVVLKAYNAIEASEEVAETEEKEVKEEE